MKSCIAAMRGSPLRGVTKLDFTCKEKKWRRQLFKSDDQKPHYDASKILVWGCKQGGYWINNGELGYLLVRLQSILT